MNAPNPAPVMRPSRQIRNQLDALRTEHAKYEWIDPIEKHDSIVQRLTTRAAIEPSGENRSGLALACRDRSEVVEQHERKAYLEQRIAALTDELSFAESEERRQLAADRARQQAEAIAEYKMSALVTARAYRRVLNLNPNIDTRTAQFHVGVLFPFGWSGTLGEAMRQGKMPWEDEQ